MKTETPWSRFDLGLVTIEFVTAMLVGAGDSDGLHDDVFACDANGLPVLPATSIAGVLRHALAGSADPATDSACRELFGYQAGPEGKSSAVRFSFGHLHDARDLPVRARGASDDAVIRFLRAGSTRDHVRIDGRGVVDDRGKFDELVVPAGARFTFEVSVDHACGKRFTDIVSLLEQHQVRFGRRSRSGLGHFRVVRAKFVTVDLSKPEGVDLMGRLPVCLRDLAEDRSGLLQQVSLGKEATATGWARCRVTLNPLGTWAIGGGDPTGREPSVGREKEWDRLPLTEGRVLWKESGGKSIGEVRSGRGAAFLIPGSSVKGALRHRVGFHARRLGGKWLKSGMDKPAPDPAELTLFGSVRDREGGRPGRVFISDVYLEPGEVSYVAQQHVSLDRFTQGPMDHLLFDELTLGDARIVLDILVRDPDSLDDHGRKALQCSLDDLCEGRLAVGVGRGHGRFHGTVEWLDGTPLSGGQAR